MYVHANRNIVSVLKSIFSYLKGKKFSWKEIFAEENSTKYFGISQPRIKFREIQISFFSNDCILMSLKAIEKLLQNCTKTLLRSTAKFNSAKTAKHFILTKISSLKVIDLILIYTLLLNLEIKFHECFFLRKFLGLR